MNSVRSRRTDLQVEKMLAFSVLTPYYREDVMYNKKQLETENEDGVTTLFYLQQIFPGVTLALAFFLTMFHAAFLE